MHVSSTILCCHYLWSMSFKWINYYRIPVGCPIAASPPGMQARMSRAILLTRVSVDEESRCRVTGMVSEKMLLDLSLKTFFLNNMKKTGFLCVTMQEHKKK